MAIRDLQRPTKRNSAREGRAELNTRSGQFSEGERALRQRLSKNSCSNASGEFVRKEYKCPGIAEFKPKKTREEAKRSASSRLSLCYRAIKGDAKDRN